MLERKCLGAICKHICPEKASKNCTVDVELCDYDRFGREDLLIESSRNFRREKDQASIFFGFAGILMKNHISQFLGMNLTDVHVCEFLAGCNVTTPKDRELK
jgi:hypothetical protein